MLCDCVQGGGRFDAYGTSQGLFLFPSVTFLSLLTPSSRNEQTQNRLRIALSISHHSPIISHYFPISFPYFPIIFHSFQSGFKLFHFKRNSEKINERNRSRPIFSNLASSWNAAADQGLAMKRKRKARKS